MKMIPYLLFLLLSLSCTQTDQQGERSAGAQPDLTGHWKLYDTEIVEEVPFLNLHAPEPNPERRVAEDSPWDSYTAYDLVFEADSMYMLHYPIQAFASVPYFLDSGYLHVGPKDERYAYPAEMVNDTLVLYRPLLSDPGYFKEKYLRTNFNDSILNILKTYGINYPELAGTWLLVREEDYDYGTHYELQFPHSIPDSIVLSREQMISALHGKKIYMMPTDGFKRDYSFWYQDSRIYFKPGEWFKQEDDPMIHFDKK